MKAYYYLLIKMYTHLYVLRNLEKKFHLITSQVRVPQCHRYTLIKTESKRSHGAPTGDRRAEILLEGHDLMLMHRLMDMG